MPRIVFSSKLASQLSKEEMNELREKGLTEAEIETRLGKVSVVSRVFAGQEVKFITFPDEVDTDGGVKVSVSATAEKLPKEVLEELVGHTVAIATSKKEDQVALRQEYDTPHGHFHTFAEFNNLGGNPIVYVGLDHEIAKVEDYFKKNAAAAGQHIKIHSSPKSRAAARKRKEKAKKKVLKKERKS